MDADAENGVHPVAGCEGGTKELFRLRWGFFLSSLALIISKLRCFIWESSVRNPRRTTRPSCRRRQNRAGDCPHPSLPPCEEEGTISRSVSFVPLLTRFHRSRIIPSSTHGGGLGWGQVTSFGQATKKGPQSPETPLGSLGYRGYCLVAAATAAATSASTAAAATATAAAAASAATGEHRVVNHKPDLAAQVLDVINGRLF